LSVTVKVTVSVVVVPDVKVIVAPAEITTLLATGTEFVTVRVAVALALASTFEADKIPTKILKINKTKIVFIGFLNLNM
jgi:hypothetical protein